MQTESRPQRRLRHGRPAGVRAAAWKIHLALAAVLVATAAIPPCVARAIILGILAAASPALLLRSKWGASEYIGVSAALAMIFWPAAAVLAFATHTIPWVAWLPAVVASVACAFEWRSGRAVRFVSGPADRAAAAFALALAIPVAAVSLSNGPFVTPQGEPAYEARSWFSSDSFYLFSLAQASLERRTYPPENPFYPGAANCYPSLMHCGLGVIASTGTGLCARDCWRFFTAFALLCAPLWVVALLRRAGNLRAGNHAYLAAAAAGCLFLARPDFFVAIQSQALALPVLLLVLWALGPPRGALTIRRSGPPWHSHWCLCCRTPSPRQRRLALICVEAVRKLGHRRGRPAAITAFAAVAALAALYLRHEPKPVCCAPPGRAGAAGIRKSLAVSRRMDRPDAGPGWNRGMDGTAHPVACGGSGCNCPCRHRLCAPRAPARRPRGIVVRALQRAAFLVPCHGRGNAGAVVRIQTHGVGGDGGHRGVPAARPRRQPPRHHRPGVRRSRTSRARPSLAPSPPCEPKRRPMPRFNPTWVPGCPRSPAGRHWLPSP